MGDVAMTVPIIRLVLEQNPDIKLSILTKAPYIEIFREFKQIDVIALDTKRKHKGLLGLLKLRKELKELKIDSVIDLHNVLRTNFLKLFWGKGFYQIDKGRKEKRALINGKFQQIKTTQQRYLDVFEESKIKINKSKIKFPEKSNFRQYKISNKINLNTKLIGIAPFAKHESKTYSLEKMTQVISYVSKKHTVLLFGGGEKEEKILQNIANENNNVFNLTKNLSLSNQMDFISNLDLMVSMDSANGHLAAMYGVKVITIWGVTHPYAGFTPFNQNPSLSITVDRKKYPKIPTSIYGNKYPEDYKNAINSIAAKEIIKKIEQTI